MKFDISLLSDGEKKASLIQAYCGIEWRAGKQFVNDAMHGHFNERVWFHDGRPDGSDLTERQFYEEIAQLREQRTARKRK